MSGKVLFMFLLTFQKNQMQSMLIRSNTVSGVHGKIRALNKMEYLVII